MLLVVLAVLRAGFVAGIRPNENEKKLTAFLQKPPVHVLIPDEATTFHFASVYLQLRTQVTPIPTHDMWIAALALQHGVTLYARDKHFDHLPQLMRM